METLFVFHCMTKLFYLLIRLTTAQGYVSDKTTEFVKTLATTVPHHLCVVYMCNSGAEATDLASRIVNR